MGFICNKRNIVSKVAGFKYTLLLTLEKEHYCEHWCERPNALGKQIKKWKGRITVTLPKIKRETEEGIVFATDRSSSSGLMKRRWDMETRDTGRWRDVILWVSIFSTKEAESVSKN